MKVDKVITEDEAALYDRQIRLWGIDAQRRLLSSRILLINMKGLGAEISKNLVLSGINSLTLLDSNDVTEEDLKTNFLIPRNSVGKNRAEACVDALQNLNPMVKVIPDKNKLEEKDEDFFSDKNFDIVCVLSNDFNELVKLNNLNRNRNVLYLCGYVYGLYGYMFVDYNEYQFITAAPQISEDNGEKKNGKNGMCSTTEKSDEKLALEEKRIQFKSFEEFLSLYRTPLNGITSKKLKRISKTYFLILLLKMFFDTYGRPFSNECVEDKLSLLKLKNDFLEQNNFDKDFLNDAFLTDQSFGELSEHSSVNAILGGVIAQEIIKAISKKNEPTNNFFLFDGNEMTGEVITI